MWLQMCLWACKRVNHGKRVFVIMTVIVAIRSTDYWGRRLRAGCMRISNHNFAVYLSIKHIDCEEAAISRLTQHQDVAVMRSIWLLPRSSWVLRGVCPTLFFGKNHLAWLLQNSFTCMCDHGTEQYLTNSMKHDCNSRYPRYVQFGQEVALVMQTTHAQRWQYPDLVEERLFSPIENVHRYYKNPWVWV